MKCTCFEVYLVTLVKFDTFSGLDDDCTREQTIYFSNN